MSRMMAWLSCFIARSIIAASSLAAEHVMEPPREIPIACDVDVVVVGGSSRRSRGSL